jgi:AraC-like DNA-binding protein
MKSEFYLHVPVEPLNKWIQYIWISSGEKDTTKSKVLPNGAIELIINFGDKQKILDEKTLTTKSTFKDYWIAGLQTHPIIIQSVYDTNLLGIRFLPGGAYPFFKFPINRISDLVIEADWLKKELEDLRNKIFDSPDYKNKTSVVEEYLKKKFENNFLLNNSVSYAVNYLSFFENQHTIEKFIKETGYSHKHFISLFRDQVGTSPKELQRILRLQSIIRFLKKNKNVNWVDLANRFFFFDQAHFINDFKKLTSITPKDYLKLRTFDENHCVIR